MIGRSVGVAVASLMLSAGVAAAAPASVVKPSEARAIAKDAYVYAFPMLENYANLYEQLADPKAGASAGRFGHYRHANVPFAPESNDVASPDIDTLRSWAWLDLRAEPLLFVVPAMSGRRYHAVQFIDLYTHNFAYIGSRSTGQGEGRYLVAGPRWKGNPPAGIHRIFRSETDIVLALVRIALNGPDDVPMVKSLQSRMEIWRLSVYLSDPRPPAAPTITFPPYDREQARSAGFIAYLNFLLQFCQPPHRSEGDLMKRFAGIGIGPGVPFDPAALAPERLAAIEAGVQDGLARIAKQESPKYSVSWNGLVGTRKFLENDYLKRAVAADRELYGDSVEEVWTGEYMGDGSRSSTIHFPKGELPDGRYFWFMTLYTLPDRFLYANPLQRYSLGDRTSELKQDDDEGLTLYVGHRSPGKAKESNWLPAPEGPYSLVVRIYGPNKSTIEGEWKLPPLVPAAPAKSN